MTKKYKELNKSLISLGVFIPFDVLVYLNDDQSPLLFKKGIEVEARDIKKMNQYPDGRLIILKEDYELFIENGRIKNQS